MTRRGEKVEVMLGRCVVEVALLGASYSGMAPNWVGG